MNCLNFKLSEGPMTTATAAPPEAALEPGFHYGIPMEDYLALDAMSASQIETFRRSPLHWKHAHDNPDDSTSRALEIGTAVHLAALEPDLFQQQILRAATCGRPLKSGARQGEPCGAAAFHPDPTYGWLCGKHGGVNADNRPAGVLAPDEYDSVMGMRDAILSHPRARTFFEGESEREVTGIWEDGETGVLCRMRSDIRVPRAPLVVDLKSTRDGQPWAFGKQAADTGYHRKMAWYRRGERALGRDVDDCAIIAVENTAPYGVAVYLLKPEDVDAADREITRLLDRFAYCREADFWPSYGEEFQTLRLPAYATQDYAEEED